MASGEKKTLRFAVGGPDDYRSAIWRLWVQGNDVYLAARAVMGFIKFSLHHSGKWRLAWTERSGILAKGSSDRVEGRWTRPPEFRRGWTQGPAIIVPHTGIQHPFRHHDDDVSKSVVWSPTPRPGYKLHFTVLFANLHAPVDSWSKVLRPGDKCLGALYLKDRDTVALCRREVAMVEKESSYILPFVRNMRINYDADIPEVNGASVFSAGTDDAGQPYLLDMALGWENVQGTKPMA
jgi:hypothetical protein